MSNPIERQASRIDIRSSNEKSVVVDGYFDHLHSSWRRKDVSSSHPSFSFHQCVPPGKTRSRLGSARNLREALKPRSSKSHCLTCEIVELLFTQFAVKRFIKAGLNRFAKKLERRFLDINNPATHSAAGLVLVPFRFENSWPLCRSRLVWNQL